MLLIPCLKQHLSRKALQEKGIPPFMLKQRHSLLCTKLHTEACTRLCSFPKPLAGRYQLQQVAPEDRLGQTPAWHCHKLASPHPGITKISNLASTILELSPARGEKDRRQRLNSPAQTEKKQRLQSIGRTKILILFFHSFFLFPL